MKYNVLFAIIPSLLLMNSCQKASTDGSSVKSTNSVSPIDPNPAAPINPAITQNKNFFEWAEECDPNANWNCVVKKTMYTIYRRAVKIAEVEQDNSKNPDEKIAMLNNESFTFNQVTDLSGKPNMEGIPYGAGVTNIKAITKKLDKDSLLSDTWDYFQQMTKKYQLPSADINDADYEKALIAYKYTEAIKVLHFMVLQYITHPDVINAVVEVDVDGVKTSSKRVTDLITAVNLFADSGEFDWDGNGSITENEKLPKIWINTRLAFLPESDYGTYKKELLELKSILNRTKTHVYNSIAKRYEAKENILAWFNNYLKTGAPITDNSKIPDIHAELIKIMQEYNKNNEAKENLNNWLKNFLLGRKSMINKEDSSMKIQNELVAIMKKNNPTSNPNEGAILDAWIEKIVNDPKQVNIYNQLIRIMQEHENKENIERLQTQLILSKMAFMEIKTKEELSQILPQAKNSPEEINGWLGNIMKRNIEYIPKTPQKLTIIKKGRGEVKVFVGKNLKYTCSSDKATCEYTVLSGFLLIGAVNSKAVAIFDELPFKQECPDLSTTTDCRSMHLGTDRTVNVNF